MPDYEGPDSAFTAGRLAGQATLDSMRAVSHFSVSKLGMKTSKPMIAGVGYSGGSIAIGWAASLLASYAPELKVRAWSAGGVAVDLRSIIQSIDKGPYSGFAPISIAGLAAKSAYQAHFAPILNKICTSSCQEFLRLARSKCLVDFLPHFVNKSIFDTSFQSLGKNFLNEPTIARIIKREALSATTIDESPSHLIPVQIYHAKHDQILPFKTTSDLVDRWCDQGSLVDFMILLNGGHLAGEALPVVEVSQFLSEAFEGTLQAVGCTARTYKNTTIDSNAMGPSLQPLLVKFQQYLTQAQQLDVQAFGILSSGT